MQHPTDDAVRSWLNSRIEVQSDGHRRLRGLQLADLTFRVPRYCPSLSLCRGLTPRKSGMWGRSERFKRRLMHRREVAFPVTTTAWAGPNHRS